MWEVAVGGLGAVGVVVEHAFNASIEEHNSVGSVRQFMKAPGMRIPICIRPFLQVLIDLQLVIYPLMLLPLGYKAIYCQ